MTILISFMFLVIIYGISWIFTCGIIKLITVCFGLSFTWAMATGIWLIILILKSIFHVNINK